MAYFFFLRRPQILGRASKVILEMGFMNSLRSSSSSESSLSWDLCFWRLTDMQNKYNQSPIKTINQIKMLIPSFHYPSFTLLSFIMKVALVEHLYQIYPSIPRYANDPQQSQVIRVYDFLVRRFEGFYGRQPKYFVKAAATPLLMGDQHDYSGYPYVGFSSTQDIIVAVAATSTGKIRINNYQSAIYAEQVFDSCVAQWYFEEKEGQNGYFFNVFMKLMKVVAEEASLTNLGGLDLLIYSSFVQDQFMGWREALYSTFYSAVYTTVTNGKIIEEKQISRALQQAAVIDPEISSRPQLLHSVYGAFTLHSNPVKEIAVPKQIGLVVAHSLTPLPKKLIQGKRFNLRRCEILIAIEYVKIAAGTSKDIGSLRQLQQTIGCSVEELIREIEETIPKGKLKSEEIEQATERSLIDILREVPYANNVIDQNSEFYPRERALFFLREQLLIQALTPENLVETVRESQRYQRELLDAGSQQIDKIVEAAGSWSLSYKIIGNGWGGSVLFLCLKQNSQRLLEELISKFYLSSQNKILLSDDLQQYVQVVNEPQLGLGILNPESQIWF